MKSAQSFSALPLVVRWMKICIFTPSALWFAIVLLGIPSEGLDATVQSLGFVFIMVIVLAIPGSIVGLVLGILDWWLIRKISDDPGSNRPIMVATFSMGSALAAAVLVLQFYLSYGIAVIIAIVVTGILMSIPFLLCWRRYKKISQHFALDPKTGMGLAETPS